MATVKITGSCIKQLQWRLLQHQSASEINAPQKYTRSQESAIANKGRCCSRVTLNSLPLTNHSFFGHVHHPVLASQQPCEVRIIIPTNKSGYSGPKPQGCSVAAPAFENTTLSQQSRIDLQYP